MTKDFLPCEGIKGGNICGRHHDFVITDILTEDVFFSCTDCVGRIIVERDIDSVQVDRVYDYLE
jgi:hypothetical protein